MIVTQRVVQSAQWYLMLKSYRLVKAAQWGPMMATQSLAKSPQRYPMLLYLRQCQRHRLAMLK